MTGPASEADDRVAVADIVHVFFAAFTSGDGCAERLDALRAAFLPEAVVVRTGGDAPAVYDVEGFIRPRQALLTGGSLVDFHEWEVDGTTELYGDVAHHGGTYAKEGVQDGVPFTGSGRKSLQLVRMPQGWRISAVAWDDD